MSKFFLLFFFLLCSIPSFAFNRDYCLYDEDGTIIDNHFLDDVHYESRRYEPFCIDHFYLCCGSEDDDGLPKIDRELLYLLPYNGLKCDVQLKKGWCQNQTNYQGYLDRDFRKFNPFLEEQLLHYKSNPQCNCFWPEHSEDAAHLSDLTYILFQDLFKDTEFCKLIGNYKEQKELIGNRFWRLNLHGLSVSCVCQAFWFSHYYRICEMFHNYALKAFHNNQYSYGELIKIQKKIENLLNTIAFEFEKKYSKCLQEHFSEKIAEEYAFVLSLLNIISLQDSVQNNKIFKDEANIDFIRNCQAELNARFSFETRGIGERTNDVQTQFLENANEDSAKLSKRFLSEFYTVQGMFFNDLLFYRKAIECLDKAISFDEHNSKAFLVRAYAFFEIRDFDSALEAYRKAKEITIHPPLLDTNLVISLSDLSCSIGISSRIEFSKGFTLGTMQGFNRESKEFIPSILQSLTGIGQGLWYFVKEPLAVTNEFIESLSVYVEYVKDHLSPEQIEKVVPEVKKAILSWDALSDFEKGRIMGFAIGKYGVDIFACSGTIKAVSVYRDLKYAHASLTLEACSQSLNNRNAIIKEIDKRISFRKTLFKNGKIRIHWDKQNKHIPGSHNYEMGVSFITLTKERLEKLLTKFAGTGHAANKLFPGEPGYRERIDFGEIIGTYIKRGEAEGIPTSVGIVHYDLEGQLHLVPAKPNVNL